MTIYNPTIYLDFDGTIASSITSICSMAEIMFNKKYNPKNVESWNFTDEIPEFKDNNTDVEKLFEDNDFWDNLTFVDDYVLDFINKYFDRIVIVTIGTHNNIAKKIKWVEKHIGNVNMLPIVKADISGLQAMDKSMINMENDILIDDVLKNLKGVNAKYKILFNEFDNFNCEWNKDFDKKRKSFSYFKAHNFKQLEAIIKTIDNKK